MTKRAKGIVKPDFSRERDQKLDLSEMFAASMATEVLAADGQPGTTMEGARLLPLNLIDHNPYQARQAFDLDALRELAESIREHGVIEPVIVRLNEGRYEIVAGERRYRAAILAEQEAMPARIMELDAHQAAIVTALENLQREDLDIEDEARQFSYLCEALEVSQRELARMLGKNHVYIARRIRLLKRPDLMEEYRAGRLVLLQAAALAGPAEEGNELGEAQEAEGAGGAEAEGEGVSPRNTLPEEGEPGETGETGQGELELVEREDLPGFVVKRGPVGEPAGSANSRRTPGGGAGGGSGARRPLFRWRPLQQFHNWVGRTRIADIPVDERATVQAQLREIKEALEKQLAELEQLQASAEEDKPEEDKPEESA
jgi:ParB family transcriptional regulator, chromosome partitioning protein